MKLSGLFRLWAYLSLFWEHGRDDDDVGRWGPGFPDESMRARAASTRGDLAAEPAQILLASGRDV